MGPARTETPPNVLLLAEHKYGFLTLHFPISSSLSLLLFFFPFKLKCNCSSTSVCFCFYILSLMRLRIGKGTCSLPCGGLNKNPAPIPVLIDLETVWEGVGGMALLRHCVTGGQDRAFKSCQLSPVHSLCPRLWVKV